MDSYDKKSNMTLYVCFKEDSCIANGDIFNLNEVKEGPYVTIVGGDLSKKDEYTYLCVDVDEYSPIKPYARNEIHWLVTNIAGSIKPYEHVVDVGKVVVPYQEPHIPFSSKSDFGTHRYYNLLFKQNTKGQKILYYGNVRRFSVRNFAARNKLNYPVAGAIYRVNYSLPRPSR